MIAGSARIEAPLNAGGTQAQADVDIFPAILRERLVESADRAYRPQRRRDVRRPKVVAAVVVDAPNGRRQLVERFDFDGTAPHDRAGTRRGAAHMLLHEVRKHEHVVVDKNDALAGRARDSGVPSGGKSAVGLAYDGKRTRRAGTR